MSISISFFFFCLNLDARQRWLFSGNLSARFEILSICRFGLKDNSTRQITRKEICILCRCLLSDDVVFFFPIVSIVLWLVLFVNSFKRDRLWLLCFRVIETALVQMWTTRMIYNLKISIWKLCFDRIAMVNRLGLYVNCRLNRSSNPRSISKFLGISFSEMGFLSYR